MNAATIIDALGGNKAVTALTGLSKGRISQWRGQNHIPRPWLKFFKEKRPELFVSPRRGARATHRPRGREQRTVA